MQNNNTIKSKIPVPTTKKNTPLNYIKNNNKKQNIINNNSMIPIPISNKNYSFVYEEVARKKQNIISHTSMIPVPTSHKNITSAHLKRGNSFPGRKISDISISSENSDLMRNTLLRSFSERKVSDISINSENSDLMRNTLLRSFSERKVSDISISSENSDLMRNILLRSLSERKVSDISISSESSDLMRSTLLRSFSERKVSDISINSENSDLMRNILYEKMKKNSTPNTPDSVSVISTKSTDSTRMNTLQHIGNMSERLNSNELLPIEEMISESGVILRKHIPAISLASSIGNFCVSFRPSGSYTLKQLNNGAAAKGHDILEKTIKPSSLTRVFGKETGQIILEKLDQATISGLVAVWDVHGIKGLYLTEEAAAQIRELGGDVSENDKKQPYLKIDIIHKTADEIKDTIISTFGGDQDFYKFFYTGDYDLHDMISFSQHPHPIPSDSPQERFVIDAINKAIAGVDTNRPFDKISHNVIRHGPQYNYIAHMKVHEKDETIVQAVAMPSISEDEPIWLVNRGSWHTIKTKKNLGEFYQKLGIHIKSNWQEDACF